MVRHAELELRRATVFVNLPTRASRAPARSRLCGTSRTTARAACWPASGWYAPLSTSISAASSYNEAAAAAGGDRGAYAAVLTQECLGSGLRHRTLSTIAARAPLSAAKEPALLYSPLEAEGPAPEAALPSAVVPLTPALDGQQLRRRSRPGTGDPEARRCLVRQSSGRPLTNTGNQDLLHFHPPCRQPCMSIAMKASRCGSLNRRHACGVRGGLTICWRVNPGRLLEPRACRAAIPADNVLMDFDRLVREKSGPRYLSAVLVHGQIHRFLRASPGCRISIYKHAIAAATARSAARGSAGGGGAMERMVAATPRSALDRHLSTCRRRSKATRFCALAAGAAWRCRDSSPFPAREWRGASRNIVRCKRAGGGVGLGHMIPAAPNHSPSKTPALSPSAGRGRACGASDGFCA